MAVNPGFYLGFMNSNIDLGLWGHINVAANWRSSTKTKSLYLKHHLKLDCGPAVLKTNIKQMRTVTHYRPGLQLSNHSSCDQSCFSKKYLWAREQALCVRACACVHVQPVKQVPFSKSSKYALKRPADPETVVCEPSQTVNTNTQSHPNTPLKEMPTTGAKYSLNDVILV